MYREIGGYVLCLLVTRPQGAQVIVCKPDQVFEGNTLYKLPESGAIG